MTSFKRFFDLDTDLVEQRDIEKAAPLIDFKTDSLEEKSRVAKKQATPKGVHNNVVSINRPKPEHQFVYMEPFHYDDVLEIAEELKKGKGVVFSVRSIPDEQGKRLLDFISGAVHISDGTIQKIKPFTFLCTLDAIHLSGDVMALIEQKVMNH